MKDQNNNMREIDKLAEDVNSWWSNTFIFIKKTRVKTWQGVFILAFIAGAAAAVIWSVSLDIKQDSSAEVGKATLKISPDNYVALVGEIFDVDVILDTNNNSVVVSKIILTYNPQDFELQSWDTSKSVFSKNNPCISENKSCELVFEDKGSGKITLILPTPKPGVKTASGKVAKIFFKSLREVTSGDNNFKLLFVSNANYSDSDVILDDGKGTDVLGSVVNSTITALNSLCTNFAYSDWGGCQPDGTQTRTLTSSLPAGCKGGNPVLVQSCGRDESKNNGSKNIESNNIECVDFSYSEWGACRSNNTQRRKMLSGIPDGCKGGTPSLEQACVFQPVVDKSLAVNISSKKPKRNSDVVYSGSSFSADDQVTVFMYKKKKSRRLYLPSQTVSIDSQGNFSANVKAPASKGTYYWYVIDEATGKMSKLNKIKVKK